MPDFFRRTAILPGTAFVVASDAPAATRRMALIEKARFGALIQVCDGVADDVEIQAAINASGGKVCLSKGTFIVTRINFVDNLTLEGQGISTIVKLRADITVAEGNLAKNVILYCDKDNVHIRNLQIDGNKTNQTIVGNGDVPAVYYFLGIYVTGVGNAIIENVYAHDCMSGGFYFEATTGNSERKSIISNCIGKNNGKATFANIAGRGTLTFDSYNALIANVVALEDEGRSLACYTTSSASHNLMIRNFKALNCGRGISIGGSVANPINLNIDGLLIDTTTVNDADGIFNLNYLAPGSVVSNVQVLTNASITSALIIVQNSNGIKMNNIVAKDGPLVTRGILLSAVTGSIHNILASGFTVGYGIQDLADCNIDWSGVTAYDNICGMRLTGTGSINGGNIYNNNKGWPSAGIYLGGTGYRINGVLATGTQNTGINEEGSANYNILQGNDVRGNAVSGIVVVGANTIVRGNIGYVTENSGTAAIPKDGATTTKDWPHGLIVAPSFVTTQPKEAAGISEIVPQANIGVTNFRLVIPAAVAASVATVGGAVAGVHPDDDAHRTNETVPANNAAPNDMTLLPAAPAVNDAYYFGATEMFCGIRLNIGTSGVKAPGTWTLAFEYWNGSAWVALVGVTDGTAEFTAAPGNQDITFTIPTSWAVTSVKSISAYWIRVRVTAATTPIGIQPLGTQAWIMEALHYFWRAQVGEG